MDSPEGRKRTVSARDDPAGAQDGPEAKRQKQDDMVLELSADDYECVICCGEYCNISVPPWVPFV